MPFRSCGGHCPSPNKKPESTQKCRICSGLFHLLCYDIAALKSRLFVCDNVVFICDVCLDALDSKNSPERKRKNVNVALRQSTLSAAIDGNVSLSQQQQPGKSALTSKKVTNEQLYELMSTIAVKCDMQSNKIDEVNENVKLVGISSKETFNLVQSRAMLRGQQDMRDLANEIFRPQENRSQEELTQTPNRLFGGNRRTYPSYSTVVQSKLTVTPQPENPSSRKREKTISLISKTTGETIKSVKFPTPKQGKNDMQIGRPVDERQIPTRNTNPLTKAVWISKFHPETTNEELENYIVEQTAAKDKTTFKCTKLVKKDADVSKMSFVSFKIDTTPEVYDILINAENWPKNKHIREFIKMSPPKLTVNDFVHGELSKNASPAEASQNENIVTGCGDGSSNNSTGKSVNNGSSATPKN